VVKHEMGRLLSDVRIREGHSAAASSRGAVAWADSRIEEIGAHVLPVSGDPCCTII
jgi:hypothetical protein